MLTEQKVSMNVDVDVTLYDRLRDYIKQHPNENWDLLIEGALAEYLDRQSVRGWIDQLEINEEDI